MDCGIPFCHNGCPVNNLIPDWNNLVYRDQLAATRWRPALDQQLPGVHRPHLPGALRGGLHARTSTTTRSPSRSIECAIVDRGWEEGWIVPLVPAQKTGKRVAVVGSGPAGMACAQQLARAGHAVTLFEKSDRIGGLLRYGIPDFKMEKHLIDRRMRADGGRGRRIPHRRRGRRHALDQVAAGRLRRGGADRRRRMARATSKCPGRELGRHPLRHGFPDPAEQAQSPATTRRARRPAARSRPRASTSS